MKEEGLLPIGNGERLEFPSFKNPEGLPLDFTVKQGEGTIMLYVDDILVAKYKLSLKPEDPYFVRLKPDVAGINWKIIVEGGPGDPKTDAADPENWNLFLIESVEESTPKKAAAKKIVPKKATPKKTAPKRARPRKRIAPKRKSKK